MLEKLLFLQLANYIGDYPLQGDFLGVMKSKYDYLLFVHSFIWTGTVSLGLYMLESLSLWKIIFLFVGHFLIDRWKCRNKDEDNKLTKLLWINQFLHFIQIIIVSL